MILLTLAVAILVGFPIRQFDSFLLLISTVLMLLNSSQKVGNHRQIWMIVGVLVLCLVRLMTPNLQIEEGHNLFLRTDRNDPFVGKMPTSVYESFCQQFQEAYPPERQCDDGTLWCWKTKGIPESLYAFSSDSFWQRGVEKSRMVDHISFESLCDLKTGFVNDYDACFIDEVSDVKRKDLPYFVNWEISPSMVGGLLEWSGELWIGNDQNGFQLLNGNRRLLEITSERVGDEIWCGKIKPSSLLRVHFKPSAKFQFLGWIDRLATLIALIFLVFSFRRIRWKSFFLDYQIVCLSLSLMVLMSPDFLFGRPALWGGGDGLWTEGFGFWSTQSLRDFDFFEFWRSGENAYYLMPFLRYFRSLEDVIFGDTQYLMAGFVLLLPLLYRRIANVFLPVRSSFVFALLFCILPWHVGMIRWAELAMFGLSEPVAYGCILMGLLILLRGEEHSVWKMVFVPIFLAVGVGLRPNYLPVAVMIQGMYLWKIRGFGYRNIILSISLFAGIILTIPIHNLVFSHKWVWFTTGYHQVKAVPWSDWLIVNFELVQGKLTGGAFERIWNHLGNWLFTWPKMFWKLPENQFLKVLMGWFNILAVGACVVNLYPGIHVPMNLKRLALLSLVSQGVVLLFYPVGRYAFLAWDFSYLHAIWWVAYAFQQSRFSVSVGQFASRTGLVCAGFVFLGVGLGMALSSRYLPTENGVVIEVAQSADHSSKAEVFYSKVGKLFNSLNRATSRFNEGGMETLQFKIPEGFPVIRLDPSMNNSGELTIKSIRYRYGIAPFRDWNVLGQLAPVRILKHEASGSFVITGEDPGLRFPVPLPKQSLRDIMMNSSACWIFCGGVLSLLLFVLNEGLIFRMDNEFDFTFRSSH